MTSHSRTIAKNAAVVGGATLISRILGFIRDMVVAYALGAGPAADAFFVAFRVPNLLRRLFGEGSMTMAFVPVFSRTSAENGLDDAFALARSAQLWLLIILGAVTALALALARPLTFLIAPGFASDPALFELTASLLRVVFPYIILISSVALCMGILNSLNHFLMPALAPVALNVALITAALIGKYSGLGVAQAMAWGVIAGGAAQWLMQLPALHKRGFTWRGPASLAHAGVARIGKLMLPTVFGAAVYQINIVMGTLLASFLAAGSVSHLYYADRLVQFPLGVFGLAIGTAALPSFSQLAAQGRMDDFRETISAAIGLTMFISLPAMAGLAALSDPVVAVLFERGQFGPSDVSATAAALTAYAVGLPAIALVRPLVSAFYAVEDTRTPVLVALAAMILNVALGAALMTFMAHVGLALAVSVSGMANAALLYLLAGRKLGAISGFLKSAGLSALLSLGVGLGAYATRPIGDIAALALIPAWAVAYLLAARLLGLPEAKLLTSFLSRRARKKT